MTEPFKIDDDQLDDEYFAAEELRREIRLAIDKMDKGQLEIMLGIAKFSAIDKDKEMQSMLKPKKSRRKK